jgi:5-methylcytosine-specific restriction protein A
MQTTFRGIPITSQDVLRVLVEFQAKYPNPNDYQNWLYNQAYKYALDYQGRLYPPKPILSQITGIDVSEFSGGEATNSVFQDLGFRMKAIRNPSWARDEVILALDLYFRHSPSAINNRHPAVNELSELLRQLPIHDSRTTGPDFRNPNGVYMKMGNFLSLDPSYSGKGLASVSRLDREVWNEFAQDRERLETTANAIRNNYRLVDIPISQDDEAEEEFAEGRLLTRLHILRERNRGLVKKKKERVLKEKGKLLCEVCDFDFAATYGKLGAGFVECHHTKPLSSLQPNDTTKLSDLAIVCANCHRMLHQAKELVSIQELKELVVSQHSGTITSQKNPV